MIDPTPTRSPAPGRACCDWAVIVLGRTADATTRARTCPRHLRGRTQHRRPATSRWPRRFLRDALEVRIGETWATWARAAEEADR